MKKCDLKRKNAIMMRKRSSN